MPEPEYGLYELNHRRDAGIEVFLYWHKEANILALMLNEPNDNQGYAFIVPNDSGNDAFEHPYAYAAELGLLE